MKYVFFTMVFLTLSAGTLIGQNNPKPAPRFTSVYTNLGKSCKALRGSAGTDDASLCKGVSGYQIRVYSSAASLHMNAEMSGKPESISLTTLSVDFDESKTRVEWRLADGKPFAVIIRVPKYGEPTTDNPYFGKVTGQELIIRGLKGYEGIDLSVDGKTPQANLKAREAADKAYAQTR
jgi:hypothetical protein